MFAFLFSSLKTELEQMKQILYYMQRLAFDVRDLYLYYNTHTQFIIIKCI